MFANVSVLPRPAWVIFGGMFVNKFGNFLNIFLVLYLTARGHSAWVAGLALGAAGLGHFAGNALGGWVADRLGRRSAIAISMFGSGATTLLIPAADNIVAIIALVTLTGVFAQLFRPASGSILLDVVPSELRITAFAMLRLAVNLGMAIGPIVGGLLSARYPIAIFVGDALTSFAFGVLALTMLPETKPQPSAERVQEGGGYLAVLADRGFVRYLAAMVAATYVYIQTTATLPLHVQDAGFGDTLYGVLLGVNALVIVVAELPLTRWTQHRPPRRVMAVGLVVLGLGVAATGLAHERSALVITVLVWTAAEMIYTPIASAYPGEFAPAHLRGRYQGAEGIAHTLAGAIGPALGGALYAAAPTVHWLMCGAVAVAGALLVATARPSVARTAAAAEASV
ncbi:MFS transporter [Nonomuraea rubra]|uniref:MFS transporter n=1 Tax=Nonomuraea rubra TaxID=46180 RepID=UPI0033E1115B